MRHLPLLFGATLAALTSSPDTLRAEHRAALVIANHAYEHTDLKLPEPDVEAVVARLERHGFQCTTLGNLDNNQLKRAIEGFAGRTPVRGAALVYFMGHALPGEYDKKKTVCLLDVKARPGRGLGADFVLRQLSAKGGSLRNLLVLDGPATDGPKAELPEDGALVFGDGENLFKQLGKASTAISPPTKLLPGRKAGEEWFGPRGMVYCWCPPGTFTMGSPEDEPGRYPDEIHRPVEIKEGFWMAKYEWPRGLWRGNLNRAAIGSHKLHPVNKVSQSKDTRDREIKPMNADAAKAGILPAGWEFALPSEAQWEYAARAGTTSTYFFGKDFSKIHRYANFADKTWFDTGETYANHANRTLSDGHAKLAPVGSFAPNPWGLHDVLGNVAEWTDNAVMRGGSWLSTPRNCRSAHRHKLGDRDQRDHLGVRVVIRKSSTATPKKK